MTATIPAEDHLIAAEYDIEVVYVDFVSVLEFDFHSQFQNGTNHHAQMFGQAGDDDPNLNVDASVRYLIRQGVGRDELRLGIPMYGRSWTLEANSANKLNSAFALGL